MSYMSEDRSSKKLTRSELLDDLADAITRLHTDEPTLVAIDGRSAAGKTTLADELAARSFQSGQLRELLIRHGSKIGAWIDKEASVWGRSICTRG